MNQRITFITLGDITSIATMKRALGMTNPLLGMGWDVSIIAMDCAENRKRIAMECDSRVKVMYYTESGVREEVAQKTALIKELKPEYIYFCSFGIRNRISKRELGYKPTVFIEHSELLSSIRGLGIKHKVKAHLVEYWSVIFADAFVCASKYLVQEYNKYAKQLYKKNIPVLYSPYAYNSDVIDAPRIIEKDLRGKYAGNRIFLYMGTMASNYGLFTMLNAVKEVVAKKPEFKLLLMGKGRHWEEAKKYVIEKKIEQYVDFLGYVPESDISSYFAVADAFISPLNNSIQDIARCPSKIYMYLPFGKPILTCKIGEPAEIFGEGGYYFDNARPETLAELIIKLCNQHAVQQNIKIEEHSWWKRSVDFDNWVKVINKK